MSSPSLGLSKLQQPTDIGIETLSESGRGQQVMSTRSDLHDFQDR